MRIAPSDSRAPRHALRTEAVILFAISGQSFAIFAGAVLEIRSTESISASASEIASSELHKVRHVLRRGRKAYYVVNGCEHFGLPVARPAMVLILRNSRVAVLVDRIERMETISLLMALPRSFTGPERSWFRGLALIGDALVPIVSPGGFLKDGELRQLDSISGFADAPGAEAQTLPRSFVQEEPG